MRIELLEDVPGIGTKGEQAGIDERKAMELITERKAIDVDSCADNAKRGRIALPIWDAQDMAAPRTAVAPYEEDIDTSTTTEKKRKPGA